MELLLLWIVCPSVVIALLWLVGLSMVASVAVHVVAKAPTAPAARLVTKPLPPTSLAETLKTMASLAVIALAVYAWIYH